MRMREKNRVNLAGQGWQRRVLIKIPALFHAVVHKDMLAADVQMRTAAGYLVIRPDKGEFHCIRPFLPDLFR
ncbi:hypothetical protein SDC9_183755 [bioreactor metagenome]|uniref:Uncharacterized protein n=1 Tax=bioreactor metagenome TaxID=1076179 RepID=A0A645HCK0_9ZZZZ